MRVKNPKTTKRSRTLAFIDYLLSQPDVDLDNISVSNQDPEPNWEQARNDQSQPLAPGSPIPVNYLYYDNTMKAYVFDPEKKPQIITIQVDSEPEMTDAFALKIFRQLPKWMPIPYNVPIGVEISVHRPGIGSVYQVGESSIEWVKWITAQFERSVWGSANQIAAIGCEVKHMKRAKFKMTIVMA